ncbi:MULTISPECIES: amidohydrolase family protein [Idiomarinaceae]|uniref:Amidohydrolase family protein n=2 Tax=Pseudidiomarina TaxID=2800384 RepID=A0AB39X3Y5_9GAMM|nr:MULTISPECIES: amidohydrolase family protein [Idiomarinaceae]MDX1526454.1 amidohydrolase family protein [Pseudidiomarina maritima]MDT7524550.1 amidohydrolase family protein [Pseudidiomarina sp. GXY010]MRJ42435.1 amidohydrolase family protein [Idiomarina sp. FeN1]NCU58049.1 amidohydrolase family protein [Idiomarina sp. FenA--70]NCU60747.1 amidohydrolase family protein [Idiomarina sp. FenBw--71]
MKKLVTAVVAASLSVAASAHDMVPGKAQQQPILLQGGTLHTVTNGVQQNTDLLFEDGKITAIGNDLTVPANARVIDVSGRHVYPGLVALDTTLGLIELEAVRATNDMREVGQITPEVSGHVAYNPDSEITPTVRFNGITHAQIVPQGNLIAGRSSLLQTDGWTYEDAAEALDVGVHVNWPRAGLNNAWWERRSADEQRKANAEALKKLKRAFTDARAYFEAKKAGQLNGTDVRWEAMLGLFAGSSKLFVHAHDKRQMEQALEFAKEQGFDLVLVGARDAWRIADQLAAADVTVVYGEPYGLPSRHDEAYDQAYSTPALLAAAGVDFALAYSTGFWDVRNLAFAAGNAVAYGLDKEQALAAITIKPAEVMGVADKIGSLEVGKQASLIISQGDVMDHLGQKIQHMFIDGAEVDLNNRHRQLYQKYQQKP